MVQDLQMRSVEQDAHETPREGCSDGDSQDPTHEDPANGSPVGSAPVTIAQRDANGGADNAHGSRDRNTILSGKDDGNR